ncbi:hypothetical protein ANTRET_LOCUS8268 [Anthophora retusa]
MSNSQRRQMMQPWPLCLVPFSKTKERSVLPKYYTKVPSVARSSTTNSSSGINLDCSSNTTLATNASPFNSQTALIAEKKVIPSGSIGTASTNHYYAQNLRNNHQKALNGSRIYDPLDKDLDHDYKQIDPLLAGKPPYTDVISIKANMGSTHDEKLSKESIAGSRYCVPSQFQNEVKPSPLRFASQVTNSQLLNFLRTVE